VEHLLAIFDRDKCRKKLNTKNIYLVRHGETDFNKRGVVQGRGINAPLNEKGHRQAANFFSAYKDVPFDMVYVSTLVRTHQTMKAFIDLGIPCTELSGLDEIDWGIWEGKSLSKEGRRYYTETVKRWAKGETNYPIEGGESPEMVRKRQLQALDIIMQKKDEKVILICMHGRAMRILLPTMLGIPLKDMDQFEHRNTSLYHLSYDGSEFAIVKENETSHLESGF